MGLQQIQPRLSFLLLHPLRSLHMEARQMSFFDFLNRRGPRLVVSDTAPQTAGASGPPSGPPSPGPSLKYPMPVYITYRPHTFAQSRNAVLLMDPETPLDCIERTARVRLSTAHGCGPIIENISL